MTPERWRRIEEVYQAAADRSPAERDEYLADTCADDQSLRNEVESLLRRDTSSPDAALGRAAWLDFDATEEVSVKLMPGTRLGPYEIEQQLGAGGMGEVFRARDTRLNRRVAVKLVYAQFSNRFEREARAISALNHPHICTLYDVGPNFLVMELLEGETLASRVKKGPLPIDLVGRYGAEIARALAAAHGTGLVHRDLKPANIMLTKVGVKVLDFGLAKATGDENLTRGILGTPAYKGRFWVDMIDLWRNLQSPFSDPTARAAGLVWSHDSGSVYFTLWAEKQSRVIVRRVDSSTAGQILSASPERYDVRSLNGDGMFAADHWAGTAERGLGFAINGQLPWRVFEYPRVAFKRCQFSPDGKWLL